MKISRKLTTTLIGGTVGSAITFGLLLANLQPMTRSAGAATQLAQALAPEEINLLTKQIIVRIDGANLGSGSLIDYSDNVYTVLTNWHVVKKSGDYTVQTIDGTKHQIEPNTIQQLPGLDLAIFKFTSDRDYQTAKLGDSSNLNEGQSVYFAGYPGELRTEDNRYYRFFTASLVGILPKPTANGYSLVYNGEAFPGMSGGPVFNKNGLLIGIHGEANIHALSGAISNYGIPINSYQKAIAKLNSQPEESPTAANPPKPAESVTEANQPEVESSTKPDNSQQPEEINSVPTFTPAPQPQPEVATEPTPAPQPQPEVATEPTPAASEEIYIPRTPVRIALISSRTGIDYTKLRNLLREEKWSEADLHTYELVEQIVKTAKLQNKHIFIELKTIAEFSCPDIRTIDFLWKKYSSNKFGFSPQQEIWQSVNQQGDFSTQTWRRFATKVGWKEGEVENSSGYLLYNQLSFEPSQAPLGHLPWWFALPDEEQKVIKHLFARCNFDLTVAESEAEAAPKPNAAASDRQPNINKAPKPDNN
ncbi:GUN4 domain-containing protein [Pleurocapsales cyanobacterium LEGE 10410]|nr:GUN4 domain-containing protein [Pleurocapsales cyanobacterium LEGE 10410]